MVVHDGLPLRFFGQPNFRKLNGQIADRLKVSLDKDAIRNYIIQEANCQREILKKKLADSFVYIKLDLATCIRVNYLGVAVRFFDTAEQKTVTKTLKVMDTKDQHTSGQLKTMLLSILNDYGIKLTNVVCVVSDNASNMIKMVTHLQDHLADGIDIPDTDNNSDSEEDSSESLNFDAEMLLDDQSVIAVDTDDSESPMYENNDLDEAINAVEDSVSALQLTHMKCAAHTLQLAIHDGLKSGPIKSLIGTCRAIAKEARTPKIHRRILDRGLKGALIDQETRWGSIYLMIERLLELKDCLQDLADMDEKLRITTYRWKQIAELKEILQKPFEVTKKLQYSDLNPGYFFRNRKS